MKNSPSRRHVLKVWAGALAGLFTVAAVRPLKAATQKALAQKAFPKGYDPFQHRWLMAIDVDRCIGCGMCAEACKKENKVPPEPTFFRTWIERYIIKKTKPGSDPSDAHCWCGWHGGAPAW